MLDWLETRTEAQLQEDARNLFSATFSASPEGVWAAPGRVNLIGDHVDYAEGVSIPFALEQNTAVAIRRRTDGIVRGISQQPGGKQVYDEIPLSAVGPLEPTTWLGYVVGTIWAIGRAGIADVSGGYDVALVSDVPLGSGLSSSAALECSVGLGVAQLGREEGVDRDALVACAMRAENEVVGASTGGLDQRSSLLSIAGNALVIDFHANTVETIPCDFAASGLKLLIANTNAPHSLSDGQYGSRRGLIDDVLCELAAAGSQMRGSTPQQVMAVLDSSDDVIFRRVRHVYSETERTVAASKQLARGDFAGFGSSMNASHESLRDDFEVVTPELESAYQAARDSGALGARMTGGGFGGSVIALVADEQVHSVAEAIAGAAKENGHPAPTFLTAVPSAGARRIG